MNEAGPTIAPAEVAALLEKIAALATPGDWWVLSGSLPPGAPVSIYADIIKQVQAAGGQAIVDTSGPPLADGSKILILVILINFFALRRLPVEIALLWRWTLL